MTTARGAALLGMCLLLVPAAAWAKPPAPPVCTQGQLVTDDTANHCCWPRQVWSKSRQQCVGIPQCPEGLEAAGETCRPIVCAQGQLTTEDTRGHCCWPNQAWSSVRQSCVGVPVCPAGWASSGEACVPDASWESQLLAPSVGAQAAATADAGVAVTEPVTEVPAPLVEAPPPTPPVQPPPAVPPPAVAAPSPPPAELPPSHWPTVAPAPGSSAELPPPRAMAESTEAKVVEPPPDENDVRRTRVGLGFRAFYFPEDNRWGPAPELALFTQRGGFKGGAFAAILPGGALGIEAGARLSGGPTFAKRVTLDFGADVGVIFVPSRSEFYIDLAANLVAASVRVGPVLISLRAISPVIYLGVTKTGLLLRFGGQSGFTVAL